MAKKQTAQSAYESKYGGGFISGAQYLAEQMCERVAQKERTPLYPRFWQAETWKMLYLMQIRAANKLLNVYPVEVVLKALRRVPNAYSLQAPWLDKYLEEEMRNFVPTPTTICKTDSEVEQTIPIQAPREAFNPRGKSLKQKL